MTKVGLIWFLSLLFLAQHTFAQKVKYKDIFALLSSKQYDQAEPFLKRYLREETDNPNAFLFMAIIYHEKTAKDDILKQTNIALQHMDSAVFFYDNALKTIDEREIKKNKDYYQSYNRRDLRTGEFGVKLSDIQFDLEKKIEGLKARINGVKTTKLYFTLADSLYGRCNATFVDLQNSYSSEREFLLRAEEKTLAQLSALSARFDSVTSAFNNYKSSSQNLGKTGYNQVIKLQPISDFKKDGTSQADFYQDDLTLWDYKKFADASIDKIRNELMPVKEKLISFDIEINKLREKLNKDSVSVNGELAALRDDAWKPVLLKIDENPFPVNLFSMKIADLQYKSTLLESKKLRDSANVHFHLQMAQTAHQHMKKLDSVTTKLMESDLDTEIKNYDHFVTNTYGNGVVLKSYIKAMKEYAEKENKKVAEEVNNRLNALKWIVLENDSVPLAAELNDSTFKLLMVNEENYTVGLMYSDSLNAKGYFFSITPSRRPDVKAEFTVDKTAFKQSKLPQIKVLTSDVDRQVYFSLIYSAEKEKEKYPVSVAKIYRLDGLAWSNNYQLPFLPVEMGFKIDTGELIIKGANQEVAVLDKNGKQVGNK